jgi:thiol-disulfide isomerase/thioredoxin
VRDPLVFKAKRRTVVTVTAALAVLLAGALIVTLLTSGKGDVASAGNSVTYPAGHRPLAPDLTGTSLTGTAIKLSSYRGKTVVLNFWGSWCAPCRSEAGVLALLDKQYGSKGVAFLGDDVGDTPTNALAFTRGVGISYPSINDQGYAVVTQLSQVVPVSDTPTTVVIDKTGHVAGTIIGAINYGEMTTLLRDAAVTQ